MTCFVSDSGGDGPAAMSRGLTKKAEMEDCPDPCLVFFFGAGEEVSWVFRLGVIREVLGLGRKGVDLCEGG